VRPKIHPEIVRMAKGIWAIDPKAPCKEIRVELERQIRHNKAVENHTVPSLRAIQYIVQKAMAEGDGAYMPAEWRTWSTVGGCKSCDDPEATDFLLEHNAQFRVLYGRGMNGDEVEWAVRLRAALATASIEHRLTLIYYYGLRATVAKRTKQGDPITDDLDGFVGLKPWLRPWATYDSAVDSGLVPPPRFVAIRAEDGWVNSPDALLIVLHDATTRWVSQARVKPTSDQIKKHLQGTKRKERDLSEPQFTITFQNTSQLPSDVKREMLDILYERTRTNMNAAHIPRQP